MSINGAFRRIHAALYQRLREDPALVARVTRDDRRALPPELLANMPAEVRHVIEADLRRLAALPVIDAGLMGEPLHVDKAWHALHVLIAGDEEGPGPGAASYILGGEPCGDDAGYGPARLLSPVEVAAIADDLPPAEDLASRFDPDNLSAREIYPGVWDEPPTELWEWIGESYSAVRAYYRAAATAGHAMVLWMC